MCGTNITAAGDELRKVPVSYFHNSLVHPKPAIEAKIRQLRIVYQLDIKKYGQAKRQLPYVVCGIFTPAIRKKENFAYIDRLIVDIDKLSAKGLDIGEVRGRLQQDPRVMLCFLSPSEDGLKVMFRLKERCYDAGLYSAFYKAFVGRLSTDYGLEQVVDTVTSDVSRACFVSIDPDAYFNPECKPVDLTSFVNEESPVALFAPKKSPKGTDDGNGQPEKKGPQDPADEILAQIKVRLGMRPREPVKKTVYVPEELQTIMGDLKTHIEQTGMYVKEVRNIHYGKKICVEVGLKKGEVNLFFGKHGFSTVISPKCGTDERLNGLLRDVIEQFLNQ